MKRVEKYIILIIVIILGGALLGSVIYKFAKNGINKNLGESVKLLKTYKESDELYYQEYEIVLNDKKNNMKIAYTIQDGAILGKYNEISLYNHEYNISDDKEKKETIISKEFNENNFQIIKGKDGKSYLTVMFDNNNDVRLYVFDDKLELVLDDSFKDFEDYVLGEFDGWSMVMASYWITLEVEGKNPWYPDTWGVCEGLEESYCHVYTKIDNDVIYYLVPIYDKNIIEERVYEINNSKMTYKVVNRYTITQTGYLY